MPDQTERRHAPRRQVRGTALSVLAFPVTVRLLDISLSGVLLESTRPVELGTRGTLRFNIDGAPFTADVEVERVLPLASAAGKPTFSIGARFIDLSRRGQRVTERFAE